MFRTIRTADGKICCSGDPANFCRECKALALAAGGRVSSPTALSPVPASTPPRPSSSSVPVPSVPPVPTMAAAFAGLPASAPLTPDARWAQSILTRQDGVPAARPMSAILGVRQ